MSGDFETDMRFARRELFRDGGPQLVVTPLRMTRSSSPPALPVHVVRGMACAAIKVEVKESP
jgi:hypothetical protein